MTTSPNSETQPSCTSANPLTIDFFESGVGETIRITFPDGGLGIVDAHPSTTGSRPGILQLVEGKRIHFVCLTHPHADHGKDLIPILREHPEIDSFWHTLSDVSVFVFSGGQTPNYRSPFQDVVLKFHAGWGQYLTKIYGYVGERKLQYRKLRADLEFTEIAGVRIHVLSPEESEQNRFTEAYQKIAKGERKGFPDPNVLSAILALEYGSHVILLGADALKTNWPPAIKKYQRLQLPKAAVLKVPHHGAANAFDLRKKNANYLDLTSGETVSVLFAGDSDHPEPKVEERLRSKTKLGCLVNGRQCQLRGAKSNPLDILLPGAVAVSQDVQACQPQISFQIDPSGGFT